MQKADQILVLDKGILLEHGRHIDLIHAGGLYQKLYEAQAFLDKKRERFYLRP